MGPALDEARRAYAAEKIRDLSSRLQESSVAKFELDHLPKQREVYVKRGGLLYLAPRRAEARDRIEEREKDLGERLAKMQAIASPDIK